MAVVLDPPEVKPVAPPAVKILPSIHPQSAMPKNYRVELAMFGAIKKGAIISKRMVVRSGGSGAVGREDEFCDKMVRAGKLSETYDGVTVDEYVRPAVAPLTLQGASSGEAKDLELKISGLRGELATLTQDRDGWKAQVESRDKMAAEQEAHMKEMRAILAARDQVISNQQGEIRKLTDTLDAATKPKGTK